MITGFPKDCWSELEVAGAAVDFADVFAAFPELVVEGGVLGVIELGVLGLIGMLALGFPISFCSILNHWTFGCPKLNI
jgi:hypothetical protein